MPHLPISASQKFRGTSRAGLYGDVIETIDWSAGRILNTLKEEGLDENTLFIFSSDNGPWLNLPPRMLQKGNERWHVGSPGLLRGAKPKDRIIDGNNLLPFLKGRTPSPTKTFYYLRGENLEAIREGKWKLRISSHMREDLAPNQPPTPELFNLEVDPSERYNIADRYPEIVKKLKEKLMAFAQELNAKVEIEK